MRTEVSIFHGAQSVFSCSFEQCFFTFAGMKRRLDLEELMSRDNSEDEFMECNAKSRLKINNSKFN